MRATLNCEKLDSGLFKHQRLFVCKNLIELLSLINNSKGRKEFAKRTAKLIPF